MASRRQLKLQLAIIVFSTFFIAWSSLAAVAARHNKRLHGGIPAQPLVFP
jgi:hypothetical protein